jgi:hypothetical protein
MPSDPGRPPERKTGRRLGYASLALVAIVSIIMVAAWGSLSSSDVPLDNGNTTDDGSNGNDTIGTSVAEMILDDSDLATGWAVASPFYPGYQGNLPGEYVEAGGIGLNFTAGGEEMYVTILLVKCVNVSQAQEMWVGVKSTFNLTKPGAWNEIQYADGALLTELGGTGMGSHQGKYLWFLHKNVLCGMVFTFIDGSERTDQQLLDFADLQLGKIE